MFQPLILVLVLLPCSYLIPQVTSLSSLTNRNNNENNNIIFGKPTTQDVTTARRLILQNKMNPLSISEEYLLVAKRPKTTEKSSSSVDNGEEVESDSDELLGFGQIRPLTGSSEWWELASLFVLPSFRRQGIGKAIVQELLDRHDASTAASVCLLTLRPTMPLYEPCGFVEVTDLSTMPLTLQMEYQAGAMISKFLNNNIVCMERKTIK